VESNLLSTNEIITSSDAAWDGEWVFATVGVELVISPHVGVGADQAGLSNLEPIGSWGIGGQSVIDLGHVDDDGTVMGTANGLIGT